jgi:hypothetical protein
VIEMDSLLVSGTCELHKIHAPKNLTVEFHHIIPVAWQLSTTVAHPPYPGQDPDGRGVLWDNRTMCLCPTGHRNVHNWIVQMMHAAVAADSDDPLVAYKDVKKRLSRELQVAYDALTRYTSESSSSLLALAAAGEWGQS